MKKQLMRLGASLALLLSTVCANAEWSNDLTIRYIRGGENIIVYFDEPAPNPAGCSQGSLKVVAWEGGDPAAKNFMSMMLAAHMANKSVQIYVDHDVCLWGGWPKLDVMKLN